jgi:hypothetical protein
MGVDPNMMTEEQQIAMQQQMQEQAYSMQQQQIMTQDGQII